MQGTLFERVIKAAFLFQGEINRIFRDLGVTAQVLYIIVHCYIIGIAYIGGNGCR